MRAGEGDALRGSGGGRACSREEIVLMRARKLTLGLVSSLAVMMGSLALLAPASAPAAGCPNEQLRDENRSTSLPDCRAYEQVTPVEKGGGVFSPIFMGMGPGGVPSLVADSTAAIDGLQDNYSTVGANYSIVRGASGWVTSAMPMPASEYQAALVGSQSSLLATSADGQSGLWLERRLSWPENRADLFVTRPGGAIEDVGAVIPPNAPIPASGTQEILTTFLSLQVVGWSSDLSHILYRQKKHFWGFDETEEGRIADNSSLYELVGTGNEHPMLVGVDEEGKLISKCGTVLGSEKAEGSAEGTAVSGDGETVFFTALDGQGCSGVNELYARIGNGQADARTVAISEPSKADCQACDTEPGVQSEATFEGASADGSKVFFETSQPLLGDDGTPNLYEYDFDAPAGERVVRVSGGDSTVSDPVAEVEGHAVAVSQDGSHVYFVARGVLTTNSNGQGQTAQAGANNLYVFERDAEYPAGRTEFIADLSALDAGLWKVPAKDIAENPERSEGKSSVTPDGRFLVFASVTEHLTPDDASTAQQVFEYGAQTGSLVRVSIGQDGYNDNGNTDVAGASLPSGTPGLAVTADGSYVFFQSTDGLTPQALNHQFIGEAPEHLGATTGPPVFANNVYEYHGGETYLISDGRDVSQTPDHSLISDVELLGTDESGADVLFTTVDQLVPQDVDTSLDVYDARVDGGFPAPTVAPECAGEACQGQLSPAPVLLSPGSEFQVGGGNLVSPVAAPAVKTKSKKKRKKKSKHRAMTAGGRRAVAGRRGNAGVVGPGRRRGGRS
jgi:hypothetical protein